MTLLVAGTELRRTGFLNIYDAILTEKVMGEWR